jgi:hypothetical protein
MLNKHFDNFVLLGRKKGKCFLIFQFSLTRALYGMLGPKILKMKLIRFLS